MNCLEINFILDSHATDELTAGAKQTVELHFKSCQACRDAWAGYREIAAQMPPKTPQNLRARIAAVIAARAPEEARWPRRSLVLGGVLAIGAAAAAGIALQIADRSPELARRGEEPAPAAAPSRPASPDAERVTGTTTAANRADDVAGNGARIESNAAPNPAAFALDAHSIVIVTVPDPAAEPRAIAAFTQCRERILEHLRAVPGLNVIADERVAAFDVSKMQPQEIARELGAGTALVLKIMEHQASCSATQLDARTGDQRSATLVFVDPKWQAERWTSFAASVAEDVRDATFKDSLTVLADAEATVLNTALSDAERASALFKLRQGLRPLMSAGSAVVTAAAQIGMTSRDAEARARAWLGLRGVRDPYLVQPLLHSLANDADENVRRAAAYDLAYLVDEPGVRDALARAAAEDPSAEHSARCCIPTVREAARRSLLSEQELRDLALATALDDTLTDEERLRPLSSSPDGRALPVSLTEEAARAVFDLGRRSKDKAVRAQAWYAVGRASPQPEFAQAFLDDLAGHPDDNVRGAAAVGLAHYLEDPAVRKGLERAAAEDSSQDVRQRASSALEGIAR